MHKVSISISLCLTSLIVNSMDSNDQLFDCQKNSESQIIQYLIDKDRHINAIHKYGWTSLHLTAQLGCLDMLKIILEKAVKGASVNVSDEYGRTALHMAACSGNTQVVKLLIEKGADVNALDQNGKTPLYWAAYGGNPDTVKLLIDTGADITIRDDAGFTARDKASSRGYTVIVKVLEQYMQLVALVMSNPKEALHKALELKYISVVKRALQNAQIAAQDLEQYNWFLQDLYAQTHDLAYKALAREYVLPVFRYALALSQASGLESYDVIAHIVAYASGVTLSGEEIQKLVSAVRLRIAGRLAQSSTVYTSNACSIL